MSLSALVKAKVFVLKIPKASIDEIVLGTDSYRLGIGTPIFGTMFHYLCKMLNKVPHSSGTIVPLYAYYYPVNLLVTEYE